MNLCPGIKRDGSRCTVSVEPPKTYCWWHDPANADERKRAAARGGKRGGRGRPQAELAEVKAILRTLADDVVAGNVETGRASVASQILNTYIRAVSVEMKVREVEELVGRLEALEETLEAGERRGRYGTY
jgi:predicted RNA-binding Zn ribbon-like protein